MEEQAFALMLRQVLTEYDFESIDIEPSQASVRLRREVYAENGKGEVLEFIFTNPTLIKVIENVKSYFPTV